MTDSSETYSSFYEGREDFRTGQNENPYPQGDANYGPWADGWTDAFNETVSHKEEKVTEEKSNVVAAAFAETFKAYDDKNYPYDKTEALWDDHLLAVGHILGSGLPLKNKKIALRHLVKRDNGHLVWQTIKTVWEEGKWVSGEHDPRAADPEFREYLRLKAIYED